MDVNQTVLRDDSRHLISITFADLFAVDAVDAVHDPRLRIRESSDECPF